MMKVLLIFITLLPRAYIVCSGTPLSRSGADLGVIPGETVGVNLPANTSWGPSIRPVKGLRTSVGARLGTHPSQGVGTLFGQGARTDVGLGARPVLGPSSRYGVGQGASLSTTLGARPKVRLGAGLSTGGGVGLDALPNVSPDIRHGVGLGASPSTTLGARPKVRLGAGLNTGGGVGLDALSNVSPDIHHGVGLGASSSTTLGARPNVRLGAGLGNRHGAGLGALSGAIDGGNGVNLGTIHAAVEPIDSATRVGAGLGDAGLGGAFQKTKRPIKSPAGGTGAAKVPTLRTFCPTAGYNNPPGSYTKNCVCIFAGACNFQDAPYGETLKALGRSNKLVGFAPTGMKKFAVNDRHVGAVCEEGVVAALFDCKARISLYAATVIHGHLAHDKTDRPNVSWKTTNDQHLLQKDDLIAEDDDYKGSGCLIDCFKDESSKDFKYWDGSSCYSSKKLPSTTLIDKGHMINVRYGNGNSKNGAEYTFIYTNAVPQVGSFNRGAWNAAEKKVMERTKNCQKKAKKRKSEARMYVVVGVIPSRKSNQKRFFGKAGFSNFQSPEYRILFPEIMWTAGCCLDSKGKVLDTFAFWGNNRKNDYDVEDYSSATSMFNALKKEKIENFTPPTVFPAVKDCNESVP